MNTLALRALALVAALVVGFGIGWYAKGVSVKAGQATVARAETQAVVAGVTKQATEQHATQVAEQAKSVALTIDQTGIRAAAGKLQQEIDRAPFIGPNIVVATPAVLTTCPDDPIGSADFERLYNAAASGADPAAAASASAR